MNILIASYFFFPENTPRAFRTTELAKIFLKNGHKVDLFIPEYEYDYSDFYSDVNLKIFKIQTGFLLNKKQKYKINHKSKSKDVIITKGYGLLKKFLIKVYNYFTAGRTIEYYPELIKAIRKTPEEYDLIISISLPFIVNYAVARAFNSKCNAIKIVDYGDPFYYYQKGKIAPYFKWLEKRVLNNFYDYVLLPTEKGIEFFVNYNIENKIKIIPQGFDFSEIKTARYKKNEVITFGYAGLFYNDIRDPRPFFDFLDRTNKDFRFIVYTDLINKESFNLIKDYVKKLGEKFILHSLIPRIDCVYELSKLDFLVNFESYHASPSKLIDYTLSGRPILSIDTKKMDDNKILNFLNGDYKDNFKLDISKFDINNIYREIMKLKE